MGNIYTNSMVKNNYIISSAADTFLNFSISRGRDWQDFCATWDNLLLDRYMNDGGSYRYRRYSAFEIDLGKQRITQLEHTPYQQSLSINSLNGGIQRHYEPLERNFTESPILQKIIHGFSFLIHSFTAHNRFNIKLHPYRIIATEGKLGEPAPEGLHQDGVDYVISFMIKKVNILGGESYIADNHKNIIKKTTLNKPGEFILTDDRKLFHGVSSVCVDNKYKAFSYRDVLVIAYSLI